MIWTVPQAGLLPSRLDGECKWQKNSIILPDLLRHVDIDKCDAPLIHAEVVTGLCPELVLRTRSIKS
jgi:hypothetical protein